MVFRVSILVKDPDPVFEWTGQHVVPTSLVRQVAKGVNYESWKAGAIISICPADHPDFGWLVQTIVKHRETAEFILSTWKPQVDWCKLDVMGP